jgi:hypothetical protein
MSALIKMFSIDVNSDMLGQPAAPGLYAASSPREQVRWYRGLGCNAIQTFCVSLNGYAWYRSSVAPVTPGMKGDFLKELIGLAHAEDMKVHGYFCLAGNAWFRNSSAEAREQTSALDCRKNIPLTTAYLDYFCRMAEEAVRLNELDGVFIDWFEEIVPLWIPAEKQIFEEVMGRPFPRKPEGTPREIPALCFGEARMPGFVSEEETQAFRRAATLRAWGKVHTAIKSVKPDCKVWLNVPFREPGGPLWAGSPILKEADMMLTERCDLRIARWLRDETGGKPVLVNLGGLGKYQVEDWRQIVDEGFHLFGYCRPEPDTLLPNLGGLARLRHVGEAFRFGDGKAKTN